MTEATTLGTLAKAGILSLSDGYRTRADQLGPQGIPILRVADVLDGVVAPSYKDHILEDYRPKMGLKISQPGDVLITTKGTVGRVARMPEGLTEHSYSPQLCFLRSLRTEVVDPDWLYYWARSPQLQSQLDIYKNQTDMAPYVSLGDLRSIRVEVPALEVQQSIAKSLGSFDALLEQNRALAGDIAALASTVAERFMLAVRERPTRPLTEIATITRGFSYKSAELVAGADTLVNLKNIGRGGTFERRGFKPLTTERYKPAQVLTHGDVVVSMTDLTQNREVIARPVRVPRTSTSGRMVASLDLSVVRPREGYTREFLAALLAQPRFHSFAKGYCNGTTVLHMSARVFDDYEVPVVEPKEVEELTASLQSLYAQHDACMTEIDDLIQVRDDLLPMLVSGLVHDAKPVV